MTKILITVPDSISPAEARLELAISLYKSSRISQGEAAEMAGCSRVEFLNLLAEQKESFTNIGVNELDKELETWRELRSQTAPPSSS